MEGANKPPSLSPHYKHDSPAMNQSAPISQRRGGDDLPPLAHLDSRLHDPRESRDIPSASTVHSGKMASMASPNNGYVGPPPPYSYHPTSVASAGGRNGYISPPTSREPSGEDREGGRQSLPSIHEALGKTHSPLYAPSTSQATSLPPPPPPASAPPNIYHPPSTISPTRRSYPDSHPSGPHSYHSTPPSFSSETSDPKFRPPYRQDSHEDRSPPHRGENGLQHPPQTSVPTPPGPPNTQIVHPPPSSPSYPLAGQQSAAPVPPPAYRSYQPAYSYPPPAVNTFAAVNTYPQSQWRPAELPESDDARKPPANKSPPAQHYGEAVKRHLDIFDLETSLNEMAEGCGRGLDFARHFGSRAHQNHRSGPTLASLPTLQECEDEIKQHERVLNSVARIRDFVIAHQVAEQQRSRDEPHTSKPSAEFVDDLSLADKDQASGGFAGADAKKRRGRNAPPGRCHSCNRAETPEWRRGPDGARTLCNACGLHYAKLTRKHGAKAGLASSNLRPKENNEV